MFTVPYRQCWVYTDIFPGKFPSNRPVTLSSRPTVVLPKTRVWHDHTVNKPACTGAQVFLLARQEAWHKQKILSGTRPHKSKAPTQGFTGTEEAGLLERGRPTLLLSPGQPHTDMHFPAFTLRGALLSVNQDNGHFSMRQS